MHGVLRVVAFLALVTATTSETARIVCHVHGRTINMSPIDPFLCTHLIFSFVGIHENTVAILDLYTDKPDPSVDDGLKLVNTLRQKNPSLKTMVAIKQTLTGVTWTQMAANASSREEFADNVVKFLKTWNFDGAGVYWTYPLVDDTDNYLELLKALRKRFDRDALILTTLVIAPEPFFGVNYSVPQMNRYFDFILLNFYVKNKWDYTTAFEAPLRAALSDTALKRTMTVEASVAYWLSQGVPKEKLVIHVPMSGFNYVLDRPDAHEVGSPITGYGVPGPIIGEAGVLSYNEICLVLQNNAWNVVFDEMHRVPYAFKGNRWFSYENVKSVKEKAQFVARLELGGAMVWNIHFDDFNGTCGEKHTLLKTLNAIVRRYGSVPEEVLPAATRGHTPERTTMIGGMENTEKCTGARNMRDPYSCGFTTCVPNSKGDYDRYHFECNPGACYHQILGKINADDIGAV